MQEQILKDIDKHANEVILNCTEELHKEYNNTTVDIHQLRQDFETVNEAMDRKMKFFDNIGNGV